MIAAAVAPVRKLDFKNIGGLPGFGREIVAGFTAALSMLPNSFAYGALIFSGPLRSFLAAGIASALMTCFVSGLAISLTSRFRTAIAGPSGNTAAVVAVLMASLTPAMEGLPPNQRLALAYAALFAATVSTAAALLLVGFVRAGKLGRFVPYPVLAGFMGATGWLMVTGAIRMVTNVPLELRSLAAFAQPREGLLLAALLGWTTILWIVTRRIKHPLVLPAALILASLTTDLALPLFGVSSAQAHAKGILFSIGNAGWPGIPLLEGVYFQAEWKALPPVAGAIGAVMLIAVLQTLFLASGLEMKTRTEVDLDDELRKMGWANLASAALGGFVGQVSLGATIANQAAGGTSRITGFVVSFVALLSLVGASAVLDFIPSFVLGGAVLVHGLVLLREWAVTTYKTLPRTEWILVIGIIAITAWLGFVPAEFGGLLAACLLFALSVSRVEIIRSISGLDAGTSSVVRPEEEMRILAEHGSSVQVLDLRGFVFFGSAYHLREKVKTLLADEPPLMLIFDFGRVVGIDSSAAAAMDGISHLLAANGVVHLVVGLSPAAMRVFRMSGGFDPNITILADIDEALERGEKAVLAAHSRDLAASHSRSDWLSLTLGSAQRAAILRPHLVGATYKAGDFVCRHGDQADDLNFIQRGRVSAVLERGVNTPTRVRVFGPHTLVGEIAFMLSVPRTASLHVDEDAIVWSLDRSAFEKLMRSDSSLMLALLQDVLRLQSERLAFATRQIAVLRR
ncbi:MAG: SLC26A/SulP transporter family protein [Hyphomicrobiales bacterium]|nr:SLC26A/SulP transporter family protein [Hyphomicrobiales bacterium]